MMVDPFTVEVIRHGLTAAAEEMTLTVMRSARSPLLREAGDMSSALTDAEGGADRPGARHPGAPRGDGADGQTFPEAGAGRAAGAW